jgi:ABC-type nitrate/sulfonate/bicarbonate transport system substrate-binding protein
MTTLRLGLEWFTNPDHVPLLMGLERGWFAEAGVDLEMVEPEEHLDAMEAIEQRELDVAVTEPLHLVEDRAEGRPAVGFARFLHTNGGVMYLEDSGIERPRDMAGCRIQYPGAPGPGGKAIVQTMIEADGGRCEPGDLTPVNNSFYHTDALIEDMADVATLAFYNFEILEARHRGAPADFFALKDWGIPDFCQLILITSESVLEAKRDALRSFLTVLQRGIDTLRQQPEVARDTYFDVTDDDPDDPLMDAIFEATVPCFNYDFSMTTRYYDALQDWMVEHELIEETQPASDYWTNDILFPTIAGSGAT